MLIFQHLIEDFYLWELNLSISFSYEQFYNIKI